MKENGNFSIFALGGLGEIGMNCLVVETGGRLLVLDCGVMFSSEQTGVDLIHPGFEYLIQRQHDIEGIVLTHAHEDHISGIPFLLQQIDAPIFTGTYAIGLLNRKTAEASFSVKPMTRELQQHRAVEIGPFRVTAFPMPHSIVQNTGLLVEMPTGRLLHTGDFKLRIKGPDQGKSALDTLSRAASGPPIDLMLSDSTGAEETEDVGEESHVADTLDELFAQSTGRVFTATFSSNLYRVRSIMQNANKHGRKVALCGLSVQNHLHIAQTVCGLDFPPCDIVPMEEALSLSREKLAIIVSGTQGEYRSALNRLALDSHHQLRIDPGDTVILSSRIIPGNELAISTMIDRLIARGARVSHQYNRKDVHVSGHGGKNEIRSAIAAVRPRCFVPVHGTVHHLHACADLAREAGVENVAVALNGQVVQCQENGLTISESPVPTRRVYVDSGGSLPDNVVRERRILGANGALFVMVPLDRNGQLGGTVEVMSKGVVAEDSTPWLAGLVEAKVPEILGRLALEERGNTPVCHDRLRSGLRRHLSKVIAREPLVLINIRNE